MLSETISFPIETPPDSGAALEVAEGILWIRLPLPMKLDHVNIYALDDGDGWTVIDTGMHSRTSVALWGTVLAGPLQGRPVTRVILTHHHPDHVGNAGWLAGRGAEIWASRTSWLMARMLTLDAQEVASPEAITFYRRAGMPKALLDKRATERPFNFADSVHPIPLGFTRLQEGDRIRMGGRDWAVHVGHGHAPEHLTFWAEDGDLVISGDQIIPGISSNLGVYPTEPEADPVGDWLAACEYLKQFARDGQLVLPGHKRPFLGCAARLEQLISNHHEALKRLSDHLHQPRRAVECFEPLFGRRIDSGTYGLALVEAVGHLNHMLRLGQVERSLDGDGAYVWQKN